MKNLTRQIGLTGLLSAALLSCDEDPLTTQQTSTKVQFQTTTAEIEENGTETTIIIQFSRPASADATLSLKAGDGFQDFLNTVPAIENGLINLPFQKGDVAVAFKLQPIDNSNRTGNKVLDLALHSFPSAFTAGTHKSLSIVVRDDETSSPPSVANFIHQDITLDETNTTGVEYQIHLSEALASAAFIKVTLSSEKAAYGSDYVSEPAAETNVITLALSAGQRVVGFKVKPVNNSEITGELLVKFTITQTGDPIVKGQRLEQTLTIRDEELAGKPRGYEITAGSTTVKRFYEYDSHGRIARVNWENYTPYLTQGTDTYFYDANNNIVRINKHAYKDILYHWTDGRIQRSEELSGGVVQSYAEYEYDEAGNVAGVVSYHRQDNGEFLKGMFTIHLYFQDGNLYKSMTYQDSNDPEEPSLLRTQTYDGYIDVSNPFPMTEVVPGVRAQSKLATLYRIEENELDLTYDIVYQYLPNGFPLKRTASAPGDTQDVTYHYY